MSACGFAQSFPATDIRRCRCFGGDISHRRVFTRRNCRIHSRFGCDGQRCSLVETRAHLEIYPRRFQTRMRMGLRHQLHHPASRLSADHQSKCRLADADLSIAAAKAHHIHVIMDMVMNHTSDQSPRFKESRSSRNKRSRRAKHYGEHVGFQRPLLRAQESRSRSVGSGRDEFYRPASHAVL